MESRRSPEQIRIVDWSTAMSRTLCLRLMGMARLSLRLAQKNGKTFCSKSICYKRFAYSENQFIQKLSGTAFSSSVDYNLKLGEFLMAWQEAFLSSCLPWHFSQWCQWGADEVLRECMSLARAQSHQGSQHLSHMECQGLAQVFLSTNGWPSAKPSVCRQYDCSFLILDVCRNYQYYPPPG